MTKMVYPDTSINKLKLYLCHLVRLCAAVLLHEAGKDGSYVKLCLIWLSNAFGIHLHNTRKIFMQHNEDLSEKSCDTWSLAHSATGLPDKVIHDNGLVDTDAEIDDED